MTTLILLAVLFAVLAGGSVISGRRAKTARLERSRREMEPVRRMADEDVTRFGEELQQLDLDTSGRQLDEGTRSDYQRALDSYESAKQAVPAMQQPDDVRNVTTIVEDGRYAMACVRARIAGEALPQRRPPCFFDPRHGLSVTDVSWAPAGGTAREVPACALDAERVQAGADPDVRQVMVGSRRVPYWQGGPAYQPYAAGYFGAFTPMSWMFTGMMFGGMMGGWGDGFGGGWDGGYDSGFDQGYDAGYDQGFDQGGGDWGGGDGGGLWSGDWGGGDGGGFGDFGGGDFGGF